MPISGCHHASCNVDQEVQIAYTVSLMLEIINLHAKVGDNEILRGVDLKVAAGEVHAIMGPNGSGKSTLAHVLAGRPGYTVTAGEVRYKGKDLLALSPEERAREGVFLAFQYPVEIPGVSNVYFLKAALNAIRKHRNLPELDAIDFLNLVKEKSKVVEIDDSLVKRPVNEGFSGGEKKRNEIFQMAILDPALAILDETDSGLDIDALRIVATGVNELRDRERAMIVVTHYQRLLDYIIPDFVHVLVEGRIVRSGGKEMALELEAKGYALAREGARRSARALMSPVAEEKDVFRASIEALGAARRGDEPAWLEALRRAARKRFDERPLPTTRDEAWRFTSVAPILRTAFRAPVEGPRSGAAECMLAGLRIADHRGPEIVFVNGRHAPEISTTGTSEGVEVLSLREALARAPQRLEPHLGRVSGTDRNVFADLNAATADDGAVVLVAPGRRAVEPIHVLFLATSPGGARTVSHPRTLIVTGRGSEATVVESYGGPPGESYLVNAVTEIVVEDGAGLHHVRLQREGVDGFHLATTAAVLGRDARLSSHSVSLGAALSRHDLRILLSGPGAECVLNGLFVGRGTQHVDHHTCVDHAVPHGTSRELYKGILDERAHGVFDGKVLVRAGASKTDAQQANKNLLLPARPSWTACRPSRSSPTT